LTLALLIGLVQVQLRTAHMQAVYRIARSVEQERQLKQDLERQLLRWSECMETPQRVKEQIAVLALEIVPPSIDQLEPTRKQWAMSGENDQHR